VGTDTGREGSVADGAGFAVLSGQEEERKTDRGKRRWVVVCWCCGRARLASGLLGGEARRRLLWVLVQGVLWVWFVG